MYIYIRYIIWKNQGLECLCQKENFTWFCLSPFPSIYDATHITLTFYI